MRVLIRIAKPLLFCLLLCLGVSGATAKAQNDQLEVVARLETEMRQAQRDQQPQRALEFLREIVKTLDGLPQQPRYMFSLYVAERNAGNFRTANNMRERLLAHPQLSDGIRVSLAFFDARYRATVGDSRGAQKLLEEGSALLAKMPADDPTMRYFGNRLRSLQAWAEATIQRADGHTDTADAAMQRALAANDAYRRFLGAELDRQRAGAEHNLAIAESDRASLISELINLQIETGRLGAAELTVLDWLKAARETPAQRPNLRLALKRYGDVLLASRRFERALATFDQVIAGYRAAGRSELASMAIITKKSRIHALMCLERWQEAYDSFREMEQATQGNAAAREFLRGGIDRALVRIMAGYTAEGGGRLMAGQDPGPERLIGNAEANLARSYGADHPKVVLAQGIHALIHTRQGNDDSALPLFRRYVEKRGLTRASDDASVDESALSQLYHRLILESYLALLARRAQEPGAVDHAFQIADALRGSRVQQAIAASAARSAIGDPELAKLVRAEQDLAVELAGLYRLLGERNGDEADAGAAVDPRPRIQAVEKRRAELLATLRSRYPEYDRLVRPAPPPPGELAAQLVADEVFVSIYGAPEATYVFAVGKDGKSQLHVAKVGAREIAADVQNLRAALDVGDIALERLPIFDVAVAHKLYRELLEPLKPVWGRAQHLIVSASGPLAQLPFSLLVERPGAVTGSNLLFGGYADVAWLVRDRAISHVPSAAAFVALRRLPPAGSKRQPFAGFGDPDFGSARTAAGKLRSVPLRGADGDLKGQNLRAAYRTLPPLPDTRDEVLALAKALKAGTDASWLGATASRNNVLQRDLSQRAVVAFATHGLQPGDLPGLDEPALALSLPSNEAQSPLLTLSDVLSLKLDADWVVLSACNTAGADSGAAEALSGLGRGFFYAGARALLVTHWPVESASARQLVSSIFSQPPGTRAGALRGAQLELIKARSPAGFSYAHPLFWAPFTLVGDGGR